MNVDEAIHAVKRQLANHGEREGVCCSSPALLEVLVHEIERLQAKLHRVQDVKIGQAVDCCKAALRGLLANRTAIGSHGCQAGEDSGRRIGSS